MGRATQITKGVSHIAITLTDRPPPAPKKTKKTAAGDAAGTTTATQE